MTGEPPITTTGTLVRRAQGNTFIARLPIGAEVRAHPSRTLAACDPPLEPGNRVRLEFTPYDFSKARITARVEGGAPETPAPDPTTGRPAILTRS